MKKLLICLALLVLLVPAVSLAAQFKSGENVNVGQSEKTKNLYIAGQKVIIDAPTSSDLTAGARTLEINGAVENDVFAAANALTLRGDVGKNARLAGGDVSISGNVGEDLAVVGGNISISNSSRISGDLMMAGSQSDIAGTINGNIYLVGDKVTISGTVLGNVIAKDVTNLTVTDSAKINGKLTYYSPNQASIFGSASIGSVDYHKFTKPAHNYNQFVRPNIGAALYGFFAIFIALLLIIYLFPRWIKDFAENAFDRPLAKVGYGFLTLIITPIVLIVAIIMSVGLLGPIVGILGTGYVLGLILSSVLSSLLAGIAIIKLSSKNYVIDWKLALIGALVLSVVGIIPVIGSAAQFIFFIWALGQLIHQILTAKRS